MMMMMMINTTAIRMPHICGRRTNHKHPWEGGHTTFQVPFEDCSGTFMFFHQYFLFSLAALVSNWEAPACSASARSSSSDSFWSRSNTLSTLTRIISTTCTRARRHFYFIITFYLTGLGRTIWAFLSCLWTPALCSTDLQTWCCPSFTDRGAGRGGLCRAMQALHNSHNYIIYQLPIRASVCSSGGKVVCVGGTDVTHTVWKWGRQEPRSEQKNRTLVLRCFDRNVWSEKNKKRI